MIIIEKYPDGVVGFNLPKPGKRSGDAYLRMIPRTEMDIAIVGAGVCIEIDKDGKFSRGLVGEQEGYWEDFPVYISDEKLLGGIIHANAA